MFVMSIGSECCSLFSSRKAAKPAETRTRVHLCPSPLWFIMCKSKIQSVFLLFGAEASCVSTQKVLTTTTALCRPGAADILYAVASRIFKNILHLTQAAADRAKSCFCLRNSLHAWMD